ncbi:hypothetical protein HOD08_00665 [bacterium]|nr:hypothetical protein [bacterium]
MIKTILVFAGLILNCACSAIGDKDFHAAGPATEELLSGQQLDTLSTYKFHFSKAMNVIVQELALERKKSTPEIAYTGLKESIERALKKLRALEFRLARNFASTKHVELMYVTTAAITTLRNALMTSKQDLSMTDKWLVLFTKCALLPTTFD